MYQCPNCSGNLKFNIEFQKLACEHCNSQFNPFEFEEVNGAEENNSYDVTVFTCPQCAGELYTTDNTIAGYCSFCGSSTILESRIEKELRPNYIIPFRKTKEDCKKAYKKMMFWAIFAPKELKKEQYIESFRGIYMPYWLYDVKQQKAIVLHGKKSHRSGDYIITKHYDLCADVDIQYNRVSYDGSSSFADNISGKIAPFNIRHMKKFTPAFLSGFYADAADVEDEIYASEVIDVATQRTSKFIKRLKGFSKYTIDENDSTMKFALGTEIDKVERAMFPVWFLSYRNEDRVAYATVNGQTGKVVADLPVDLKKYLFGSVILAIPLFILLNLFLTVRPTILLAIVCAIAMIVAILHALEMKEIVERDGYLDDKGAMDALNRKEKKVREEKLRAEREMAAAFGLEYEAPVDWVEELERQKEEEKEKKKKKDGFENLPAVWKLLIIYMIATFGGSFLIPVWIVLQSALPFDFSMVAVVGIAAIGAGVAFFKSNSYAKQIKQTDKISGSIYCLGALAVAFLIALLNPVHDAFYYAGVILGLIAVFFTLVDLIKKYNILATRKLPQFYYRGGDDRA